MRERLLNGHLDFATIYPPTDFSVAIQQRPTSFQGFQSVSGTGRSEIQKSRSDIWGSWMNTAARSSCEVSSTSAVRWCTVRESSAHSKSGKDWEYAYVAGMESSSQWIEQQSLPDAEGSTVGFEISYICLLALLEEGIRNEACVTQLNPAGRMYQRRRWR